MKFSAQEEYGLRCLLRIGKSKNGLTIPEISQLEGLSTANVGKLLRILRLGGFIESARGQNGGYKLVKQPNEIIIGDVLTVLGGKFYENDFCNDHSGAAPICANSIDCSVRSLLKTMQNMFDQVLSKITLRDMLGNEEEVKLLTINLADIDSN